MKNKITVKIKWGPDKESPHPRNLNKWMNAEVIKSVFYNSNLCYGAVFEVEEVDPKKEILLTNDIVFRFFTWLLIHNKDVTIGRNGNCKDISNLIDKYCEFKFISEPKYDSKEV